MEITITLGNESIYSNVKPKGQLHCWVRSFIADLLASTSKDWITIFGFHNSRTYNNQWMARSEPIKIKFNMEEYDFVIQAVLLILCKITDVKKIEHKPRLMMPFDRGKVEQLKLSNLIFCKFSYKF
ncbi:unnamed protein product [Meloidogyne enterolobii]|uniref:Phospholipase B-like n=2 Tax=Meloidogyne enterolobii TaxID=390850 RepID=A0A6V7XUE8_MELEN|nr:unnamed protein product [Meloidogyne enterolobii]